MTLMIKKTPRIASVDGDAVVKEALRRIDQPSRRLFLQRSLTLGGLSMLTGCAMVDDASVEVALMKVSRFNGKVQGWLFDPNQLAPTYPESMITPPFPFNAYYGEHEIREVDADTYRLEGTGMVPDRHAWTLAEVRTLPLTEQVTRHNWVGGGGA